MCLGLGRSGWLVASCGLQSAFPPSEQEAHEVKLEKAFGARHARVDPPNPDHPGYLVILNLQLCKGAKNKKDQWANAKNLYMRDGLQ